MKNISGIILGLASLHAFATNVNPPFFAQPVANYSRKSIDTKSLTRLKLAITTAGASTSENIQLGNVTICSATACFRPETPTNIQVSDTRGGGSTRIFDIELPYGAVQSIFFETPATANAVTGSILLSKPLVLNPEYAGAEILVEVEKHASKLSFFYAPIATATNLIRESGTVVYYNPKTATSAILPMGVIFDIPAGATSELEIFNIAVHDTGGIYPLLDIYPVVKFAKQASVTARRIVHNDVAEAPNAPPATPTPESVSPTGQKQLRNELVAPSTSTFKINATGVIRGDKTSINTFSSAEAIAATAPGGWTSCTADLSYAPNQQIISNGLSATGNENINWCETIAPFVHIGISNMLDAREIYTIPHMPVSGTYAQLPLQLITYWMPNTQMTINGFNWDGDSGTSDGQYGYVDGYVMSAGLSLGSNRVGGGSASYIISRTAGNKVVMQTQGASPITWAFGSDLGIFQQYNTVSSSTSIVNNGVCATDSLSSSWSAVGTTPTGRLIFISSTSGSQTTAAQLCTVFKALGANYALRLDGGPSTGITIGGKFLNPLTGLYSFKYGSARHIAYSLKVTWPGW